MNDNDPVWCDGCGRWAPWKHEPRENSRRRLLRPERDKYERAQKKRESEAA